MGPTDTLQEIRDRLADLPERLASVLGDNMRQSGPVRGPDGRFSSPDSGSRERPSRQPATMGPSILQMKMPGFQLWRQSQASKDAEQPPQQKPIPWALPGPAMNMQALAMAAAPLPTATPAGPAPVKTALQPSAGPTQPVRSVAAPQAQAPAVAPLPAKPPPLPASSPGRKKAVDPWNGYQTFPVQSAARKPPVAQPSPAVPSARTSPVQPSAVAQQPAVRQPSPAAAAVPSPVAPPRPAQPILSSPSARAVGPQPSAQPVQRTASGQARPPSASGPAGIGQNTGLNFGQVVGLLERIAAGIEGMNRSGVKEGKDVESRGGSVPNYKGFSPSFDIDMDDDDFAAGSPSLGPAGKPSPGGAGGYRSARQGQKARRR